MKELGKLHVQSEVTGSKFKGRVIVEISRFKVEISTEANSICLEYNPPIIEVDISSSLRSMLHAVDYSWLIRFFLKFSKILRSLGITLIVKHYGKTFLMLGKKGI